MRTVRYWSGLALSVVLAHAAEAASPEGGAPAANPAAAAPAGDFERAKPAAVASADPSSPQASDSTAVEVADPALLATGKSHVASLHAGLPEAVKRPAPPPVTLRATIDLTSQRMTIHENGKAIHTWKISSGRAGYATPTGRFLPQWKSRMWYSRQYDSSPMPYAVFFNGGIATHGTSAVHRLGRPASHGCIRLHTSNAKTFYTLVGKHGALSTRIAVTGRAPGSSKELVASRSQQGRGERSRRRQSQQVRRNYSYNAPGVRYVQTPYGYRVIYASPSSRVSRYGAY